MNEFVKIFNKVGGKNILKQYAKAGVLGFAMIETAVLGISRKSLEIVRLAVDNRILCKLRSKYRNFILDYKKQNTEDSKERKLSNKVWVCWLQGIENAPILVQRCFESLQKYLKNREIILLTEDNYKNFVTFPDYIQKKIDNGIITKTHFSDLLRLELLIHYGGTWIDATVLCTNNNIPDYILNSELFTYQCLKPGRDGHAAVISSWLITACTNHPILMLTRELLYEYWKKYNYMKDYFLLHDFFQLAIEAYPEEWNKVVPVCNSTPHILLLKLMDPYDAKMYEYIKDMSCFHKLSYKFTTEQLEMKETNYDVIIKQGKI